MEEPLVFNDVVYVFQGDADASGFWCVVHVFVEGSWSVLYLLLFRYIDTPHVFLWFRHAVLLDVLVVPNVEEGGVPLEGSEVWRAFELFC